MEEIREMRSFLRKKFKLCGEFDPERSDGSYKGTLSEPKLRILSEPISGGKRRITMTHKIDIDKLPTVKGEKGRPEIADINKMAEDLEREIKEKIGREVLCEGRESSATYGGTIKIRHDIDVNAPGLKKVKELLKSAGTLKTEINEKSRQLEEKKGKIKRILNELLGEDQGVF